MVGSYNSIDNYYASDFTFDREKRVRGFLIEKVKIWFAFIRLFFHVFNNMLTDEQHDTRIKGTSTTVLSINCSCGDIFYMKMEL